MASDRIGIRELRASVAAIARRAGSGERIVITVDGRPIAQIGPLEPAPDREPTIDDLAARGLIVPARRHDRPRPDLEVPLWAGTRLDRLLVEVRGR